LCEHRVVERLYHLKKLIKNNSWEMNKQLNCWIFRKQFADPRKDITLIISQ